ncbi:MAG: thioredoxin [Oscillibacter sp.]|nr:thioredoxin [Oscillibacter sp.]
MALQHLTEDTFDAAVNAAPLAMVDFWATWCGPCKMMGPIVEKLAAEYDGKALVAKVDTDEEADLAEKFEVSTIPTLVFLKNGAEFDRKIGVTPEAALREVLDANL